MAETAGRVASNRRDSNDIESWRFIEVVMKDDCKDAKAT